MAASKGEIRLLDVSTNRPLFKTQPVRIGLHPGGTGCLQGADDPQDRRLGRGAPEFALEPMPELKPLLQAGRPAISRRAAGVLRRRGVGGRAHRPAVRRALSRSRSTDRRRTANDCWSIREDADRELAVLLVEQQVRAVLSVADCAYVLRLGDCSDVGKRRGVRSKVRRDSSPPTFPASDDLRVDQVGRQGSLHAVAFGDGLKGRHG